MLALCLVLLSASPEAELFEDDVTLPKTYTWTELLAELRGQPLDLNAATAGQLQQLPWLTLHLAQAIVAHRDSIGGFSSINELLAVPGIDASLVESVRPYLRVLRTRSPVRVLGTLRAGVEDLAGLSEFTSADVAERVRVEAGDFRLALVADKDVGERDLLDFVAGGLSYQFQGLRIAAGNFEMHSGQGLLFSRPDADWFGSGTSLEPHAEHFSLPQGFAENTLLQGAFLGRRIGPFDAEVFASRNRLDATPGPDSGIRSINYGGIHDDSASRANRRRLQEDLLGAWLGYAQKGLSLGLGGYGNRYDQAINPEVAGFQGRTLDVVSGFADWQYHDYRLGWEVAHTLNHGWAGAFLMLGDWRQLRVRLDLAYVQREFYSPHSRDRSLSRTHDDLTGTFRLNYHWSGWGFTLYGTTQRDFILDSMPARLQLSVEKRGSPLQLGLQWKQSFKDESWRTAGSRLDVGWTVLPGLSVSGRFDDRFKLVEPGKRGIAYTLGADFNARALDVETRVTRFLVTDQDCRVYAYEIGMPGNNRVFDADGWRAYIAGRVRVAGFLHLTAKFGGTRTFQTVFDAGLSLDVTVPVLV